MALFRSRSRKPLGPGGRVITGLAGLALVVYIASGTVSDYIRLRDLASGGRQASAQVVETRADRGGRRSSSNKYYVTALFATADTAPVLSECQVSEACYLRFQHATLESPMATTVVFDPAETGNWHPADDLVERKSSVTWMLLFYAALSAGLLGTAVWGVAGLVKKTRT